MQSSLPRNSSLLTKAAAISGLLGMAAFGASAHAQTAAEKALTQRPDVVQSLFACRGVADAQARLQCYDARAAELEQASDAREVVMIDKEQVRETRRGLFGLSLPSLKIFGGEKGDSESEQVREVEGTIASARKVQRNWLIVMEDGAQWLQTDGREMLRDPRKGGAIIIRQGALGGYLAKIDNQSAIRMKRVN